MQKFKQIIFSATQLRNLQFSFWMHFFYIIFLSTGNVNLINAQNNLLVFNRTTRLLYRQRQTHNITPAAQLKAHKMLFSIWLNLTITYIDRHITIIAGGIHTELELWYWYVQYYIYCTRKRRVLVAAFSLNLQMHWLLQLHSAHAALCPVYVYSSGCASIQLNTRNVYTVFSMLYLALSKANNRPAACLCVSPHAACAVIANWKLWIYCGIFARKSAKKFKRRVWWG